MSQPESFGAIFDMDGVLVDSYFAHFQSWRELAAELGVDVTEADFARHFGRTSREIVEAYWGVGRFTDEEIRELDRRKEEYYRRIIAGQFPEMPGVRKLLRSLQEGGFRLAVGSSGPPENVALVLDRLEARDLFHAVVTGMDVTRGKPDPQVFLLAAERLGLEPKQCVVIEDAPVGIEAAHAAGMAAVGLVSTGRNRQSLSRADLVVDTLEELNAAVLRQLILDRRLRRCSSSEG
ncbi:MAG: HAD family phosphatase [Thermoguttaceae bacterium]|nr:HAD family phosphatase [Thermoguttaceae bacterium]MDW8079345.1 HAD family phosphatase [Thermoguttaceae bacterium]